MSNLKFPGARVKGQHLGIKLDGRSTALYFPTRENMGMIKLLWGGHLTRPCVPHSHEICCMKYIDISPLISEQIAVFPGDCSFKREISLDFVKGDNLVLSSISSTVHLGSHTDAPSHYHPQGKSIAEVSLDYYLGLCQVINISKQPGTRIYTEDIKNVTIQAERILFKTGSFPNPEQWNSDFNSLSPELINYLAQQNVILVGIDTPSIDPEESQALESHGAVYQNKMAILEGVVLDNVDPGLYTLIALPLKIKDADATPVRAILICTEETSL